MMHGPPDLLLPACELRVGAGSEAEDMRAIARAVLDLGGRLEATLNLAVANAEMPERLRRDCGCDIDAITEAIGELAGFFAHAADEADANDALPPEREREAAETADATSGPPRGLS